ncbi:uncharacterized protein LOC120775783 [Bactrocera tryoni]|uniref:uncharacterized protein LOC120775783 n=1 Tax=Bactrocera tryoni TaxID=59916 RepID=UPI001A96CBCD|nr:uncharacterized protein LOC120775783 [Bactrocera tryoni]
MRQQQKTITTTAATTRLHSKSKRAYISAHWNFTGHASLATHAAVAAEVTTTFKQTTKTRSIRVKTRDTSISVQAKKPFRGPVAGAVVEAATAAATTTKTITTTTTCHYVNTFHLGGCKAKRNQSQNCNRETFNFTHAFVSAVLLLCCFASNSFVAAAALPKVSTASGNDVRVAVAVGGIGVVNGLANRKAGANTNNSVDPCALKTQRNVDCHATLPHSDDYNINGNAYHVQQPIIETTVALQLIPTATLFDTTTTVKSVATASENSETVASDTTAPLLFDGASTTANVSAVQEIVEVPQIPAYIRNTAMCFCIAIMTLGVIGNIMVPIVIVKTKDMRNSTNIFLTNLSIADLLVLLVCTPTVLVEVNTPPETWVLGHEMCKAVPFVELTVAHASVLTILAISFERYYAICEPLKAGYVCTKARAILICILAWGIAAVFTSPIIWVAEYKFVEYIDGSSVAVCLTQATTNWTVGYFLMTIIVFFILPLLILMVLYAIIAKNLISSNGPMLRVRPSKPELSLKARKQVVLMLGAVVLSFFLCLLPFRLLTMWIILSSEQTFFEIGVERYYSLLYFCRIMFYLNSGINPILYNLMSTKFRKGFLRLILSTWQSAVSSITCGRYKRIRARTGTITGLATNTNTNTSNTASSHATTSSILSRQSNRRYSDDMVNTNSSTRTVTKTQIQIQMHIPCGPDNEMLAMLQSSVRAKLGNEVQRNDSNVCASGRRKSTTKCQKMQSAMRARGESAPTGASRRSVHVSFDDEEAQAPEEAATLTVINILNRKYLFPCTYICTYIYTYIRQCGVTHQLFTLILIFLLFVSPIVLIATFRMERYYDDTVVAVCFTSAETFWSAFFFVACIAIFFLLPFIVLVLLYVAIAYKLLRRNIDFHRPTTAAAHVRSTTSLSSVILRQQSLNKLPLQMTRSDTDNNRSSALNIGASAQQLRTGMRKHRKQVIFMLVAVVASFFLCLLPFRAFTLWVIAASTEDIAALGIDGYYGVLYFCRIMLYLNSALNPILYNLMSSKFRTGFWRLIISCCNKHRKHQIGRGNRRTTATTTTTSRQQTEAKPPRTYEQRRLRFKRESTFAVSSSISTSSGTERSTSVTIVASRSVMAPRSVVGAAIVDITRSTVSSACPLESDENDKEGDLIT